jgi:hypothetical protein
MSNEPSAFPLFDSNGHAYSEDRGLTKREYFAAMAMQGICVNAGQNGFYLFEKERISEESYKLADAMIAASKVQS